MRLDTDPAEYVPWVDTLGINIYVHTIGQDVRLCQTLFSHLRGFQVYVESKKYTSKPGGLDEIMVHRVSIFFRSQ